MYAFKTLSLAFLLLVANVQAGKITYTCYNKTGGIKKDGLLEQKAGGTIPDDQVQVVEDGMKEWSNGKYAASVNKRTKILIVKCVEKVENKNLATAAINEQEQLVNKHIKKTKRDDGDDLEDEDEDDIRYLF
ncbi:600589c3-efeb-4adc-b441-469ef6938a01 [Sclerotinia trifoliorum]|uniref:600589c3-efeb-4adc-b441-469ef6938a01 n=1 Tax=Sclerotinia trifoliorum TaxID=28548 RepID=A0A8H2VMH2_9HELO|nr:600589c3-efeb-4adc-b441-469ef6938a01 [Sclerotinia trifoliorum]